MIPKDIQTRISVLERRVFELYKKDGPIEAVNDARKELYKAIEVALGQKEVK